MPESKVITYYCYKKFLFSLKIGKNTFLIHNDFTNKPVMKMGRLCLATTTMDMGKCKRSSRLASAF